MVEDTMKRANAEGYRWIAGSLALVTLAQLGMKLGMTHFSDLYRLWALWQEGRLIELCADSWCGIALVGLGIAAYGISMWCWLNALRHLPLSRAYPLLSLSYISVYVAAILTPALHEVLRMQHLLGIAAILLGVLVIHRDKSSSLVS